MPWYFYAILGPLLWAIVNQADKFLVERFYSKQDDKAEESETNPGSLVLFSSSFGLVVSLVIFVFHQEVFSLSLVSALLLILAGFINIAWIVCYLYALQEDEVSTVAPLFLIQIAFAYVLGLFTFDEVLGSRELLAMFGVICGAILLSLDFNGSSIKLKRRVFFLMCAASILEVVSSVIFKYVAVENDFWLSQFWQYAGLGIAGIVIFVFVKHYRKDFVQKLRTSGGPIFTLNISSEAVTVLGNLAVNTALLLAPVAIVYTFVSFQAVYVFILSLVLTKIGVSGLVEKTNTRSILPKVIAIIVMIVAGSFLF